MPATVSKVAPQNTRDDVTEVALTVQTKSSRRRPAASSTADKPKPFAFISVVDSVGRSPAESRKFIRSHVMRGKNTKKRATAVVQEVEVEPEPEPEPEPESVPELSPDSGGSTSSDSLSLDQPSFASADEYFAHISSYDLSALCNDVTIFSSYVGACAARPPALSLTPPPHDIHLCNFPGPMTDTSKYLLYTFMVCIKENMYPLEWCFSIGNTRGNWFVWLLRDPAYLQAVIFCSSALVDCLGNKRVGFESYEAERKFSRKTQLYLRRTIEMLQKRIQEQTVQVDDATTAIVVNLALAADVADDIASSKAHVDGLKQMLKLRGGLGGFTMNRELQIKICRVDLGWCIKTGCKPVLYDDEVIWSSFFEEFLNQYPMYLQPPPKTIAPLLQGADPKVVGVFDDMRTFANIANSILESKKKLHPDVHEQCMVSIQTRLLNLRYSFDDGELIEECLRTGLLAFEVSIFLYTPGLKNNYTYLRNRVRECIERLDPFDPAEADLQLWLFLISAICLCNPNEEWLVSVAADLLDGVEWEDCVERVKDIMWVGVIHDPPGKCVYEAMQDMIATGTVE